VFSSHTPDHDYFYTPAATPIVRSYYLEAGGGRRASSPAGALPFGVAVSALPWSQRSFKGYETFSELLRASALASPRKYALEVASVGGAKPAAGPESSILIVHLPEKARLWVEGKPIPLWGPTCSFRSPPLAPGGHYRYTLRADWIEAGRWVSQTRTILVEGGSIEAVYLQSR
jgi:uncharacterized protein (TIGR03000 family)